MLSYGTVSYIVNPLTTTVPIWGSKSIFWVRNFFSSIWLKFSPEKLLRSKNSLVMSDLHYLAIFRVKIGVKGQFIDFLRSKIIFFNLAEFFTRKAFQVEKFTGHVRFALFCHFQGQNWGQRSNIDFLGQIWSDLFSLIWLNFW